MTVRYSASRVAVPTPVGDFDAATKAYIDELTTGIFNSVINVADHGAAPDLGTDVSDEINAAIDALPADNGVLYIAPGVYVVDTPTSGVILSIANKSNLSVIADGAVIRTTSATATELLRIDTCSDFKMYGAQFEVRGTANIDKVVHFTCASPGSVHTSTFQSILIHNNSVGAIRNVFDVMTTSGSNVVYSSRGDFDAEDVGAVVTIDANNVLPVFRSTIASVQTLSATLAAGVNSVATTITLNSALSGMPDSGWSLKIGTEHMFVVAGGATTSLTVIRGWSVEFIQTSHSAGDTATVYKATLADNLPWSTSEPNAMMHINAKTAHFNYGFGIGLDHPGASNMDLANTRLFSIAVSAADIAGIAVGNGTSGNILDQWGYGLSVIACGYGVLMNGGVISVHGGDFGYNLVDIRRAQPVMQPVVIDDIRSEECGMFYSYIGGYLGGPNTTLSNIHCANIYNNSWVQLRHNSPVPLEMRNCEFMPSSTVSSVTQLVVQGSGPSNPGSLVVSSFAHNGQNSDPFITPNCNRVIIGVSQKDSDGSVIAYSIVPGTVSVIDRAETPTNKTINADNNTITNIEVDNFKASAVVTASEGISSNNNDTTLPTSAAVKAYADSLSVGGVPTYVTTVGNGTSGPFTITHDLGTRDVGIEVYKYGGTWENIMVRADRATPDTVILRPDESWATDAYKVIVRFLAQSDVDAPSAPVISFVSKNDTSITVELTTAATDSDSGVKGYYWYLDGVKQNSTPVAATVGADVAFTGLANNTEYDIHLTAVDYEDNESDPSNVITRTTDAASDTTDPTPGTASFSSATTTTLTYTFTAGSDNVGVTRVDAYDADGTTLLASNVTSPWTRGSGSAPNGPLTPNTSYGTLFRYFDAAGNDADSNTVTHSTDASAPAVALNVAGAGNRLTTGAMPTATLAVASGSNRWALCWVVISHSTSNNPATYDTATLTSDLDGAWTYWGAQMCGPFSGQKQGAVLLFYKDDPAVGTHTLTPNIAKATFTWTSVMIQADAYNNVGSMGTPVTADAATSAALNLSLTVAEDNMAACGMACSSAPSGGNGNVRYSAGGSVTGSGDYMYVQDFAGNVGGGSKAFTTSSSQVHGALGVALIKA